MIYTPVKLTKQPRSRVIATSGFLRQGMIGSIMPIFGSTAYDAGPISSVLTFSGSSLYQTKYGLSALTHPAGGANGSQNIWLGSGAQIPAAGDLTAVAYVIFEASTSGYLYTNVFVRGSGVNDGLRLYLTSATNLRFQYIDSTPTAYNLDLTIPTVVDNGNARPTITAPMYGVAIVRRGGVRFSYFMDAAGGIYQSAGQSTGGASFRGNSDIGVGKSADSGTASSVVHILNATFWNRGLSDLEVRYALQNLWSLWAANSIDLTRFVNSTAAPTFQPAWARPKSGVIGAGVN